ncbi:MAG: alpha/beta hydrolase [Verrucomicrobiota bacterium]
MNIRLIFSAAIACLAAGANLSAAADPTNAAPGSSKPGMRIERNIPYVENGHPKQVFDLFLPEKTPDKPMPLMIWIHGGAWMGGSQSSPPVLYLLSRGIAVASIQYRFSQDAIWPAQAHDCKAAIRFLRANAGRYGLDPDRFAAGGDSAGGHLAAFVGTSGDVKETEGDLGPTNVSSRVQAVVDWFGPTDLVVMGKQAGPGGLMQHDSTNSPESRLVGGPIQERKELARTANPITYIDRNDPPFLIMHGDADRLVPLAQSVILAEALMQAGVREVTLETLHGADHEGPQFFGPDSRRLVEEFVVRTLSQPPARRESR